MSSHLGIFFQDVNLDYQARNKQKQLEITNVDWAMGSNLMQLRNATDCEWNIHHEPDCHDRDDDTHKIDKGFSVSQVLKVHGFRTELPWVFVSNSELQKERNNIESETIDVVLP